jgi:hypothetical protein
MVDQATAKYLEANIGAVLSKALSEMSVQQPNDGVDFLAQWLKNYADQEEVKGIREREEKQTEEDRAITQKKEGEKAARREQKAADLKTVDDSFKALLDKFRDEEQVFQESYWDEVIKVAKQYMGAQSVYLGLLDEEGLEDEEPPLIRYTNENIFAGSPSLLDKVLPKMRDAETSNLTYGAVTESIPEEEMAAKYLWKPPPPPQDPVPEGEEPPPPPEGPKYLPVAIPCVTDVPIVHFFEMPRLGAYMATPLVYPTYYTQEAYAEAKAFEEQKADDIRLKKEKEEEREAQIKEAQEKGLEEPVFEPEEEQPEKVMVLTGTTTKMVLCMDTLGTNTLFSEAKYKDMMDLCDACAACKARSEIKEIGEQALFAIGVERRAAADDPETGLPSLREDAATALQESQDAEIQEIGGRGLEPEAKGIAEALCAKKFLHLQAKMVVDFYKEHIKSFVSKCFTVQPEVLNIMAAIAFLIGYEKAEVHPPRKTTLKWWKMKSWFQDETSTDTFFDRLESCSMEIGKTNLANESKLAFINTLMPADLPTFIAEEKAKLVDPAFEVLFNFLSTAIDYRTSALQQMQADYNERKKKAEEEEQPFEEPDLTTVDDDFEGLAAAA